MKQVLVTGGAGFIGANLARHYLDAGCRVVIYDHLGRNGCVENLDWLRSRQNAANLSVLIGDVRMPTLALRREVEKSDALFHMAAQVAVTTSVTDPVFDFQVNALGTFNMLELVRESKGKKPVFFYASTNKVYGGMEDITIVEGEQRYSYRDLPLGIPEDRVLDFHSPYGCSKGTADQYVRDYARIYDLRSVVFRQSCIYGYRQFGLEDQGWVAWFIIAAMIGRPITVYGDGKQVRDVLFIDDLVAAYDSAWKQIDKTSGRIFNIGGGPQNTISLRDLLKLLKEEVNPRLDPAKGDWRPGDQPVYVSDIRKAKAEFGWEPMTDWQSGVRQLVQWVKDNRAMLERMF
ncbi:MAG: GDP-mannose 4,6-dehydratase [Phycisphaeraceae bacterium]|nr:GDP-mannose 4,6-dehydratase [Phycisphaeraceae bacterium]